MKKPRPPASSPITRRAFVATGAAAGLAVVRPSAVRGSEANSRVRIGCIGLGGRGAWIAQLFRDHGGFEITAVADYFPEVAQQVGPRLGVHKDKCFSGLLGYQRVIASGVDAMVLKTPPYCFPEHARASIEAGCHVYMAKPVAIDVPGCLTIKRLGEQATANGLVFLVDFQLRVDPYLTECIRLIRSGAMNELRFMRVFYDDEGRPDPPMTETLASRLRNLVWTMNVALGGDRIVCAGIHAVDAMLWIAGATPLSAVGKALICRRNPHGDATDAYSLTYEFPGGLTANYSGDQFRNHHGSSIGCDVFGWKSCMETRYAGKTWMRCEDRRYKGGEKKDLYSWGAQQNIGTFHESITKAVYDNPTVLPSINANPAAILGREAGRRGEEIKWDDLLAENKPVQPDLSGLVP